ncbi:DUF2986 domain-containing protein [Vibrio sp. D404a]|uniref:DUF2986 domain-containing protein n=1 Tax=unclassified Vibrio TaxID=2614977 RepID=UPI0025571BBD|nr:MULTISPECIES: DUF2986 domain-containing protein [unclassified Vibrio]MDK9738110.1 DUF2986 domain-containing protein [Vibrio sp. D404a]MDK9796401.1 DUF2986 domain-containing protein [Vibrio sp. D449a]
MNRKKKINDILKKKQKKANAKLHKSNKPRYISKAERAKMEEEERAQQAASAEATIEETAETKASDSDENTESEAK